MGRLGRWLGCGSGSGMEREFLSGCQYLKPRPAIIGAPTVAYVLTSLSRPATADMTHISNPVLANRESRQDEESRTRAKPIACPEPSGLAHPRTQDGFYHVGRTGRHPILAISPLFSSNEAPRFNNHHFLPPRKSQAVQPALG